MDGHRPADLLWQGQKKRPPLGGPFEWRVRVRDQFTTSLPVNVLEPASTV